MKFDPDNKAGAILCNKLAASEAFLTPWERSFVSSIHRQILAEPETFWPSRKQFNKMAQINDLVELRKRNQGK